MIVFAGPSIPTSTRAAHPGIDWRPPAQAGDLLDLADRPPRIICLIDGFFDHRPAVRHKEILLLLSRGVRIFGAGSIGALRAAEMAPFGMVGFGAIFRAYATGRITGDDEVALIHAAAGQDWRPLSVPLVDLRAMLCRAVRARVLGAEAARMFFLAARAIHYVDRDWTSLKALAPAGLAEWLSLHPFSQKQKDAEACLHAARAAASAPFRRPKPVVTPFLRALARERGAALPRPGERAPADA